MTKPENAPKVISLRVSTSEEDERDLATFFADIKDALASTMDPDKVYSMGAYYIVDGQPIREDGINYLTGDSPPELKAKKKAKKKATKTTKAKKKEPTPESTTEEDEPWCNHDAPHLLPGSICECGDTVPEIEPEDKTQEQQVRDLAKKATGKLSMRKGAT